MDFPGTAGGAQAMHGGGFWDAFVARVNPALTTLLQATYLGGSGGEFANGLAVSPSSGEVLLAGYTSSRNFPGTAGGARVTFSGGINDAFIARFSPSLTTLRKAAYLGGSDLDIGLAVAVTPSSGELLVTGDTASTDFPGTAGGAQALLAGGSRDLFVARFSADLAAPGASFHTLTPCRSLDTRGFLGPLGGPALEANADRVFAVGGVCGLPVDAIAISINVTVTESTHQGDLRLYPGGTTLPPTSLVNYRAGQTRTNNTIVFLGAANDFIVRCVQAAGSVHFIVDVNGFFR